MKPLIVVEASARAFAAAVDEVASGGTPVVHAWRNEAAVASAGVVANAADAASALLAAVWGAGVVVHAQAEREIVDRLVEDLRRLGPVDHRTGEPDVPPALTHDELELLRLLRDGLSLGDAAERLHLSRRTADRRLASARRKLGVDSTAAALAAAASLPPS